jgi:hypothetical protein
MNIIIAAQARIYACAIMETFSKTKRRRSEISFLIYFLSPCIVFMASLPTVLVHENDVSLHFFSDFLTKKCC